MKKSKSLCDKPKNMLVSIPVILVAYIVYATQNGKTEWPMLAAVGVVAWVFWLWKWKACKKAESDAGSIEN